MKSFITIVFALLLAFSTTAQTKTVTVISEKANLRGTPSPSSAVVEQVSQDEVLEFIASKGAWYLVQSPRFVVWLNGNTIRLNFDTQASLPMILKTDLPQVVEQAPKRQTVIESRTPSSVPTVTETNSQTDPSRIYITGERGGCYYISSNGNKTYVDRSVCGNSQTAETTVAPSSSSGTTSSGTVQVRGYFRKDGTYVKPHTRRAPRRY